MYQIGLHFLLFSCLWKHMRSRRGYKVSWHLPHLRNARYSILHTQVHLLHTNHPIPTASLSPWSFPATSRLTRRRRRPTRLMFLQSHWPPLTRASSNRAPSATDLPVKAMPTKLVRLLVRTPPRRSPPVIGCRA